VRILPSTTTPDGPSGFQLDLLALVQEPGVRKLALHRAGDRDLAEDALQEAFYAVARVKEPQRIQDLRAFFCTVLIRKIYHLRGETARDFPQDPQSLTETGRHGILLGSSAPSRPFDEAVAGRLIAQTWIERFSRHRERLRDAVPGRSSEPGRYRELIVAVAEAWLMAATDAEVTWPDSNEALQAAYPEWFSQPDGPANNCHQRFRRARSDIQALLKVVVNREELQP